MRRAISLATSSLKNRKQLRKHFIHDFRRQGLYLATVSGREVEHSGLISSHHAGYFYAGDGHGKTDAAGKFAATGDGANRGQPGGLVEFEWRHDQERVNGLLLAAQSRVERHRLDVAAPHVNSPPTAGASTHSRWSEVGELV